MKYSIKIILQQPVEGRSSKAGSGGVQDQTIHSSETIPVERYDESCKIA